MYQPPKPDEEEPNAKAAEPLLDDALPPPNEKPVLGAPKAEVPNVSVNKS